MIPSQEAKLAAFQNLLLHAYEVLRGDPFWAPRLERVMTPGSEAGTIHLAVMVEPYLGYVLTGRKTIESRFSRQRHAPYEQVRTGDLLLLKRSGGPILGLATVGAVRFERLSPEQLSDIRAAYAVPLCAEDDAFWTARADAALEPEPYGRHGLPGHLNSQPVGAITMRWQGDPAEILELAVAADQQGRGLGRRLVQLLADEARRRDKQRLIVGTANSSIGNIAFYQKCGLRMDHVRRR